ncbi:MAG TPA: serine/threonine-protein kinase [Solirubrobacteraceae bacterium]
MTHVQPPAHAAHAGEIVLDRYRLVRRIGAGGMGVVYLAHDEQLDRAVAVKRIAAELDPDGRGEREAIAAARLSHPGIVALYESGRDEDAVYLVSELVRGRTLADLIRAGDLSDRDVVAIGVTLCDALEHAHARGVIHRDVKPSNVICPESPQQGGGVAKLTDFGIALMADGDVMTRTGDILGTLAYMAPEQARGRGVTGAADVYALGVVLFEGLSGVNPIRAGNPAATAQRVGKPLPALRRVRRDLPAGLCRAIDAAVVPEPEQRAGLGLLRLALTHAADRVSDEAGPIDADAGLAQTTRQLTRRTRAHAQRREGPPATALRARRDVPPATAVPELDQPPPGEVSRAPRFGRPELPFEEDERFGVARRRARDRASPDRRAPERAARDGGAASARGSLDRSATDRRALDAGARSEYKLGERPAPPTVRLLRARAGGALASAALTGAALAWLGPDPPVAPTAAAAAAGLAVLVLPRLAWIGIVAFLVGWLAGSGPGFVPFVVLAAVPVPLALPRRGSAWSLPVVAPLLGVIGLAGAWPALAGQARRWPTRAILGALGGLWLVLAEAMTSRRLLTGQPDAVLAPQAWDGSIVDAVRDAIAPLVAGGTLAIAALWALAAAVLPLLVRGRSARRDLVAATGWAAALAAATQTLGGTLAVGAPRGLVVGAAAGAVAAVAARAARGRA